MTAVVAAMALGPRPAQAQAAEPETARPEGVVLVVGDTAGEAALVGARRAGGGRFRGIAIRARAPEAPRAPTAELEGLRAAYLEADFLRCLSRLQSEALDADDLLAAGLRAAATTSLVFGAACAFGAGDESLARARLERASAAELDVAADLAVTNPDFQRLAESVRAAVVGRERVRLRVTSDPTGARVHLDGRRQDCLATPCELTVVPGRHVLGLTHPGHAPRVVSQSIEADAQLGFALDGAAPGTVSAQIEAALTEGAEPDDPVLARAASLAYGARLLVVVFEDEGRTTATAFDRSRDAVVARVTVRGRDAETAAHAVVREWRGLTEPTPIARNPWFWIGTAGAAAVTGLSMWLLLRPAPEQHDLVFGIR